MIAAGPLPRIATFLSATDESDFGQPASSVVWQTQRLQFGNPHRFAAETFTDAILLALLLGIAVPSAYFSQWILLADQTGGTFVISRLHASQKAGNVNACRAAFDTIRLLAPLTFGRSQPGIRAW